MKTKRFFLAAALACTAGSAYIGCANSGARNAKGAGGELVLNLYDKSHVDWTDTITGRPADTVGGGYWSGTYDKSKGSLQFEEFVLTHSGNTYITPSDTIRYWNGFTTGANGDTKDYGFPDTTGHVGSVKWIDNQWGVMAGGGIANTNPLTVQKGVPYLISYWDYYTELEGTHVLQVNLADNSLFTPQEIYICNHPWPYYGNIHGDGFARPFKPGDRFDLWIHAVKADGREDSVRHNLAIYIRTLVQSPDWKRVGLTELFNNDNDSIKLLYFTMFSTDTSPKYGPNTAVYFNMDKLKVVKTGGVAAEAATQKASVARKVSKAVEVTDYFPLTSHTGGDVTVHDATGKVALKTTVKAGEKPNLSKLPAGEYRLRHGHRAIPVKKVNE